MSNKTKINNKATKITLIISMLIMVFSSSNLNWGDKYWSNIIESDAKGYYAYLPAVFIYQDLNFGFFEEMEGKKYYNENLYYDYRAESNGKTINKYFCGTAIASAPFFLLAHGSSILFNFDADGYSKLYPIFINLASLFYLLIGLLFLNSLLIKYKILDWQRALTLFACLFGTHLYYYAVAEPGMSHVYSFAFVSMFLYYAYVYFHSFEKKYLLILAAILGIITLLRPINGLIVFILPFVAGDFDRFKNGLLELFRDKLYFILSAGLFFAIVSIQLIIYKLSTGSFLVYSYNEEGFNFLDPHFIDILFSYRKGLFIYTPLLLLSMFGGYYLWSRSRFQFMMWFGFFIGLTYIFSSWWMWYYGGSFSSRVYVEFIPLFMILLALMLKEVQSKLKTRLLIGTIAALIVFCQIQTFQYRHLDIHWSEMNKEKYWDVFLRIDKYL